MVEVCRMVADWLAGTTLDQTGADQSVATHLATLTYDGSDVAPDAPAVVDETRDQNVARGDLPATVPALAVTLEDWTVDAATMTTNEQRGTAMVLVRWCAATVNSANATRDGLYVMRAVRRSLERLHRAGEETNGRRRNSVVIYADPEQAMRLVKVTARREDTDVTTGWLVPYRVHELAV